MSLGQVEGQQWYIRNVIRFKQFNKEAIAVTYNQISVANDATQKNTKFAYGYLENSGGGNVGSLNEYSSAISGINEAGQNYGYTHSHGIFMPLYLVYRIQLTSLQI